MSNAPGDQSETFIRVTPGNANRVLAGGNGGTSAWISGDGGQ